MKLYDSIVRPLVECQRVAYCVTGSRPRIEIALDEHVYLALLEERPFEVRLTPAGVPSQMQFGANGDVVVKCGSPARWEMVAEETTL